MFLGQLVVIFGHGAMNCLNQVDHVFPIVFAYHVKQAMCLIY